MPNEKMETPLFFGLRIKGRITETKHSFFLDAGVFFPELAGKQGPLGIPTMIVNHPGSMDGSGNGTFHTKKEKMSFLGVFQKRKIMQTVSDR